MSRTQYYPDKDSSTAGMQQAWQAVEVEVEHARSGYGAESKLWGSSPAGADPGVDALCMVAAGILDGAPPLQFLPGINAGSAQLGNRVFLRWVEGLRARRHFPDTHEIAASGLQGAGQPLTHLGRLQQAFGHHDIREMREHRSEASEMALKRLGVEGYTSSGRMAVSGTPTLHVQAHEAAHGVQQAGMEENMQLPGGVGEAGDDYEQQADAVADAVVRGESAEPLLDAVVGHPTRVLSGAVTTDASLQMKWPDKNLEDLTMEEFEAAIQEMTDEELNEAWEELVLLIEISELEESEVKSKPKGAVKKEKQGKYKPTQEEIEAMRAAKKARVRFTEQEKQKGLSVATATAAPRAPTVEAPSQSGMGLVKPKHKKQKKTSAEKGGEKGGAKKGSKPTIEQMQGLQDIFLTRAINHLIMGELYELDPVIGDESCQMRTPFVLDIFKLVQQSMPANAVDMVVEYRAKAEDEQATVFETLQAFELKRKAKDPNYESGFSEFIRSNALQKSIDAKTGEYGTMLVDLISAIDQHHSDGADYLSHVCSEGAINWDDVLDPFGVSMLTDKHPIFPNTALAKRKMKQSRLSKNYMVWTATELVKKEGGSVSTGEKELGYDKKGAMQVNTQFLTAQSKKDIIAAMLLHAVQMHSGATVTKGERLELGPYWETTRLALTYALENMYPLIINLRRLIMSGEGGDRQYSSNICRTLFYEPTDEGYRYQPNPSKIQQSQGALLFQGFSMLRKGDTAIPGAVLPVSPWVFEEDPDKFLAGFIACDVANLMLLGDVGTHHPLNTGSAGTYAYGLPGGAKSNHGFDHDPGGWRYVDAIHDLTLVDLGLDPMTRPGQEYLTPEFELTEKSRSLLFPDQCPISIAGRGPEMNIKEEYQLMKLLCRAAGMEDTRYSRENRDARTAERVAQTTIPFVSTHILASTFEHEDEVSKRHAVPKTGGIIEKLDELRSLNTRR